MVKARTRIQKGRIFQKSVMEKFKETFDLTDDDVRTPVGCEAGEDIKFNIKARKLVGLSIECKNKKSLGIYAAIEQAKIRLPKDCDEAVVFKRGDLGPCKTYICVPLDHYLDIRRELLKQDGGHSVLPEKSCSMDE